MTHYAQSGHFTRCNLMINRGELTGDALKLSRRMMPNDISPTDTHTDVKNDVDCQVCRQGNLVDETHAALNMQFFQTNPDGALTIGSQLVDPDQLSPYIA